MKEVVGVEAETLPPPIVLAVHDPGFIEAERERQRREFAEVVDVAVAELTQQPDGVATRATRSPAESPESGCEAAVNAPKVSDDKTPAPKADAPQAHSRADFATTPSRIPRTPSEAAAMRREREARERAAQQAQTPRPSDGLHGRQGPALPAAFMRRR